jgi:PhoPQ-activated pathogenicity-related protein
MAMTKSAVAAMDAIQSLMEKQDISETVSKFVIVGASKRGWTTWTTGAVDDRVEAMIPIVIDLLNLEPSFKHHWSVYGFWAPAIQDYVDMEIVDWWYSPEIRSLFNLVGPFSYKDRFQMPKLLVNAAGDEFFIPTSSQFYFDELPGEKYLRYVPNADHGLSGTDALETVLAFYASILNNFPRPQFSWKFNQDGSIRVRSEGEVREVNMWSAKNPEARDFRKDKIGNSWRSTVLTEEQDGSYKAMPETPHKGWRAYFVELTYETPFGIPLKFTTPVRVIPDTLPYQHKPLKEPKKGFLTK